MQSCYTHESQATGGNLRKQSWLVLRCVTNLLALLQNFVCSLRQASCSIFGGELNFSMLNGHLSFVVSELHIMHHSMKDAPSWDHLTETGLLDFSSQEGGFSAHSQNV